VLVPADTAAAHRLAANVIRHPGALMSRGGGAMRESMAS
jgi:hypothetical protein